MKFTFTLTEGGFAREKRVLESGAGESTRHISLKILAYLLYRGDAAPLPLHIELKVGQRHKPDLVALEPETGRVRLWIDCGQIETERLGRIAVKNPGSRIVVVKSSEHEARLYARAALRDLPEDTGHLARIAFTGFDSGFLAQFVHSLRGTNQLSLERPTTPQTEPFLFVINDQSISTRVHTFTADRLTFGAFCDAR